MVVESDERPCRQISKLFFQAFPKRCMGLYCVVCRSPTRRANKLARRSLVAGAHERVEGLLEMSLRPSAREIAEQGGVLLLRHESFRQLLTP
jgi:hypothetical protein